MPSPHLRNRVAEALLSTEHLPVLEDTVKAHIKAAAGDDDRLQELYDLRGAINKMKESEG